MPLRIAACQIPASRHLFRLPFFVGGGTVKSGNRNVVEPEINAQLRCMVNQVIEAVACKRLGFSGETTLEGLLCTVLSHLMGAERLTKEKLISEDEEKQALDIIQKLTDGQIGKVDQAAKTKEKEILEFK